MSGPFFGLEYENIPALFANLVTRPDGSVDIMLWASMQKDLDLDLVLDWAEMDLVARSWHQARGANAKA